MFDTYHRNIHYMRLSITSGCNYRCTYCNPNQRLGDRSYMTIDQILAVVDAAIECGIDTFKITGGEPTLRKDYLTLIEQIHGRSGVKNITLTTNASCLDESSIATLSKYISSINISLDTLDPDRYKQITGANTLDVVLNNISLCISYGIMTKINCVLLDSTPKEDYIALMKYACSKGAILRFIEQMPMGKKDHASLSSVDILSWFSGVLIDRSYGNGPARYYTCKYGEFGIIEPIHGKFCASCNRIRLTSTGFLQSCLFFSIGKQIESYDHNDLVSLIQETITLKPKEHEMNTSWSKMTMDKIGG